MKDRKILKMFLCVVFLLGMVVAVQAGTRGVAENQIVIGTHTALSGPAAGWGIDATNGIRMRFDEASETGGIHGRKIKYIVEDSQYRVPIAVQKANKLVNRDKVFFLIGSIGTPMNNAIFPMLEKKNVPNIFPYTAARSMYEPHHKLKFANLAPYYANVRAGLKYFVEAKGKQRVCMMYQDTDFGLEIADAVNDQLKEMNRELVTETTHKGTETNFVGAITKLREADCDVVMLGTIISDTIIAVSTARKMGWNVDMVGQTAACNYVIPLKGGKGVEGLYAITSIPPMYEEQATGRAKVFFDNYKKRFGKMPSEVAQHGYFCADLAVIALEKAGKKLTVNNFLKALE
ncbi:MAG: ABC transporter substrate-binding protein, partial [Deltaproteobacteria bacterium]|nr:ABC transporter substrate-binding protein [Deltaproteobacteria bacterium]